MNCNNVPMLEGRPSPDVIVAALQDRVSIQGINQIIRFILEDEGLVKYVQSHYVLLRAALSLPNYTSSIQRDGSKPAMDPLPIFLKTLLTEWMDYGNGHFTYSQLFEALPDVFKNLTSMFQFEDFTFQFIDVVMKEIYKAADLVTKRLLRLSMKPFYQLTFPQWNNDMIYTLNHNIYSSNLDDLSLATFHDYIITKPTALKDDQKYISTLRNVRFPNMDLPLLSTDEKTSLWFQEYGVHLSEIHLDSLQIRRHKFLEALGELIADKNCPALTTLSVNAIVKKQVFYPNSFRNCNMYKVPEERISRNLENLTKLHLAISCTAIHHHVYHFPSSFTLPSLNSLSLHCLALPLFSQLTNSNCLIHPDKLYNIMFSQTCWSCSFPLVELGRFLTEHPLAVKYLTFKKIQITQMRKTPYLFVSELCKSLSNIESFILEVDEGTAYLQDILSPPYHLELEFFNFRNLRHFDFTPFWEWSMDRIYFPNLSFIRSMQNLKSLIVRSQVNKGNGALVQEEPIEFPGGLLEVIRTHRISDIKPMPVAYNLSSLTLNFPNWVITQSEIDVLSSLFPNLECFTARFSYNMLAAVLDSWFHVRKVTVIGESFDRNLIISLGNKKLETGQVHLYFCDEL